MPSQRARVNAGLPKQGPAHPKAAREGFAQNEHPALTRALREGYAAMREEGLALTREFEAIDQEGWG